MDPKDIIIDNPYDRITPEEEEAMKQEWIAEGRDPELFPRLGCITQADLDWAHKILKDNPNPKPICTIKRERV